MESLKKFFTGGWTELEGTLVNEMITKEYVPCCIISWIIWKIQQWWFISIPLIGFLVFFIIK